MKVTDGIGNGSVVRCSIQLSYGCFTLETAAFLLLLALIFSVNLEHSRNFPLLQCGSIVQYHTESPAVTYWDTKA